MDCCDIVSSIKKKNVMRKIVALALSLMVINISYGVGHADTNTSTNGFKCSVEGATIKCVRGGIVELFIPRSSFEFGTLEGEINAQEVHIETEDGAEDYVMSCLDISADLLIINGQKYESQKF